MNELNDSQLMRYSRQILLPEIGIEGQEKLLSSRVLLLGAGGLGCPVALYLAASGVGELVLVDDDNVSLSNLNRQILFSEKEVNLPKTKVARERLHEINSETSVVTIAKRLSGAKLREQVERADLVIDGTDNFQSRFAHNAACVETATPLVSGAVIRFEGQVVVFPLNQKDSPCYHCLYPDHGELEERCSESGVLGPVAGMVASSMATEAIKWIVGIGDSLAGRLLLIDALRMEWREVRLKKDPDCPACSEVK